MVLMGVAVAIRLPGLGVPLSGDEATTFWEHTASSWETLFSQYKGPNQHSLFSFFSNISMGIFGENEISFRLPSTMAGVLAIPLTWFAGRHLLKSSVASFLAAILVAFSEPLFVQSQQGRGYTLTVMFSLIVYITGKIMLSDKNRWYMPLAFVLSGFCMVLILPSNIYFLAGCGAVLLVDAYCENQKEFKKYFIFAMPVLLMGGFAAIYLLFIYDDLQRGLETYSAYAKAFEGLPTLEPTLERSLEIFLALAQPWGIPLLLLFIFGVVRLKNPTLLLIFLLPLIFNLVSGIQGPPRSYFYWLPFFMLIAANGLMYFYDLIRNFFPENLHKPIIAILFFILMVSPASFLMGYLGERFESKFVTMEEAKKALIFLDGFPSDHLFVIPWEDRVLRFYTEKRIAENMRDIVQAGKLKRIIFLGHKAISPESISTSGLIHETSFLPEYFKLVEQKGSLNIYDFQFQVSNLVPLEKDFDFPKRLNKTNFKGLQLSLDTQNKFVGQESIKVENKGSQRHLFSKLLRSATLPPGSTYVLYLYARKLDQKSLAGLSTSTKRQGVTNTLNLLLGVFREENTELHWEPEHPYRNFRKLNRDGKFYWQIVMLASPTKEGKNHFRQALKVEREVGYFDGMQAYILHTPRAQKGNTN
jgi:hypothetical protein